MVTHRLWKRARTRPQRAVCKRRLRRYENDRLQANHTFRMPAKVGPKRVRALARAGCYFDSSAATSGAGCGLDLRKRRHFSFEIVMLRPILVIASQRVGAMRRPVGSQ